MVCTLISDKATETKPPIIPMTKRWTLAQLDLRDQFTDEAIQLIQQRVREGTQDCETVIEDLRHLGEKLLGKTSGNMKQEKETWW